MRYWLSHCVRSPPRGSLLLLCSCQVYAIINPDNGPAAHGTQYYHEYLPCLLYLHSKQVKMLGCTCFIVFARFTLYRV